MYKVLVNRDDNRVVAAFSEVEYLAGAADYIQNKKDLDVYDADRLPGYEDLDLYEKTVFFDGDSFEVRYVLERGKCFAKVNQLKARIHDSDYMIVKSAEYAIMGRECEYEMSKLHKERQELRDEINRINALLAEEPPVN